MKRILLLLLVALLTVTPVLAKTLSKVAAVVNNEIISSYQLEKAVLATLAQSDQGNQLTAEQFDQLRLHVLEQLINERLVEQRIVELGLTVAEGDIDAAIEDVQRKNKLTRSQLEQALEAQGMGMASYRDQLRKEILRYKLLGREVNYKVQVTSSEVRDYFRANIEKYRAQPKVRLNHISYPLQVDADAERRAEVRKQADVSRDLLLGGEPFEKVLAAQGSAAIGGDMGELVEDQLAPELRDALRNLAIGQVSEPVEMNGQLHLFQVAARNPGDSNLFDRVSVEIEEILKKEKTDARFKEWAQELRDQGHVEIRL